MLPAQDSKDELPAALMTLRRRLSVYLTHIAKKAEEEKTRAHRVFKKQENVKALVVVVCGQSNCKIRSLAAG